MFSGKGLEFLMAHATRLIAKTPSAHEDIYLEWKGNGKEPRKVWPSALWWKSWDKVTNAAREVTDKVARRECDTLFRGLAIGVLQALNIETPGATFFVASSFGVGLYQLMPSDWKALEAALCEFAIRIEKRWRIEETARLNRARKLSGLDEMKFEDDGTFLDALEILEKIDKGPLSMWDDDIADRTMEALKGMADEERDALDIESDSDGEMEVSEESDEKEEKDVPTEIREMRAEARKLIEMANALAVKYNAESSQRKMERRFDNGRAWVEIGTVRKHAAE